MKKSFLFYFILVNFPVFCQIRLSDVSVELKKKTDFHQLITTVNPKTNEIYTFASDNEKLFGAKFSSSVFFRDSLSTKRPFNYRYLLGGSFLENNNPVAYFSTEDLTRVISVEFDFAKRTNLIRDLNLNLKGEIIYTQFADKGSYYFITKGRNENELQLIKLNGNTLIKKYLNFKAFNFENNPSNKSAITNLIEEFGLTLIEKKGFSSLLDGSQKIKFYLESDKIILILNLDSTKTSTYEINLNSFSISEKIFKSSKLVNVQQSNSLLFENNLVILSSTANSCEIQFINYTDKLIIKTYTIDNLKPNPFSSSFYSIVENSSPNNIKTPKKFISAISNSELGISIYNFNGVYIASFGGIQYRGNSNDFLNQLGSINGSFYGLDFGNLSSNYALQNNLIDVDFDSSFKEIKPVNQPLFIDKIGQFISENKNVKMDYYFFFNNFYILSYYDSKTKQIVLRKFTDGFDH